MLPNGSAMINLHADSSIEIASCYGLQCVPDCECGAPTVLRKARRHCSARVVPVLSPLLEFPRVPCRSRIFFCSRDAVNFHLSESLKSIENSRCFYSLRRACDIRRPHMSNHYVKSPLRFL